MESFEGTVLVHFDAAYNLARWLTNDEFVAEDAVQEACLRAYRFFGTRHGPNVKAWFLAIVRNVCFDTIAAQRASGLHDPYDEDVHSHASAQVQDFDTPESAIARSLDAHWLRGCIAKLPREYREVIVLRELEELSYKEIGAIVDVPIGTVMSRLARGRELLQQRMQESRRRRDA